MTDLEQKLREIVTKLTAQLEGKYHKEVNDLAVVQILQAVEEAEKNKTYIARVDDHTVEVKGWMTGQMWYERLIREYHNKADWISADSEMGPDAEHDVLTAARLAAGLEQ